VLFDAGAAASLYMSAGFIALGPEFFGRVPLVYLLDFLSIYFAVCESGKLGRGHVHGAALRTQREWFLACA
jgi:hypothetical protein